MGSTLLSVALNAQLLSTVWLLFRYWSVMVSPRFIHNNKPTHKISFMFVKTLLALFGDFNVSVFLFCCEHAWHPSYPKLFHMQLHSKHNLHVLSNCLNCQKWSRFPTNYYEIRMNFIRHQTFFNNKIYHRTIFNFIQCTK